MNQQRPPAGNRYRTRAIPTMARKKGPSGFGIFLAILLMAGIFVGMLFLLDILPVTLANPPAEPAAMTAIIIPPDKATVETPLSTLIVATERPTATNLPTDSPSPTLTPTDLPTATPTPTEKPMPYIVRGTPIAYQSRLFRTESNCATYYVAGMAVDLRESPVLGLIVKLGGTYGGDLVDLSAKTGSARLYGDSGYEFAFTNKQIVDDQMYIQLLDANGEPVSTRTYLNTSDSCEQNLLNVTFKQVR